MANLTANSPVDFQFARTGGADIRFDIQIWPRKDNYSPTDRPVQRVQFSNSLAAHESASVTLAPGQYICVILGLIREALNGVYGVALNIEGAAVVSEQGDVNITANQNDLLNRRYDVAMEVQ